jgi:hypothetical protein
MRGRSSEFVKKTVSWKQETCCRAQLRRSEQEMYLHGKARRFWNGSKVHCDAKGISKPDETNKKKYTPKPSAFAFFYTVANKQL